jgi:hypothetical protein
MSRTNGHCVCYFHRRAGEDWREAWGEYMASREWFVLRRRVMDRASGRCERCGDPARDVNHLTYLRRFHERLEDLQALCRPCHQWKSGKAENGPAVARTLLVTLPAPRISVHCSPLQSREHPVYLDALSKLEAWLDAEVSILPYEPSELETWKASHRREFEAASFNHWGRVKTVGTATVLTHEWVSKGDPQVSIGCFGRDGAFVVPAPDDDPDPTSLRHAEIISVEPWRPPSRPSTP